MGRISFNGELCSDLRLNGFEWLRWLFLPECSHRSEIFPFCRDTIVVARKWELSSSL